MTRRLRSEAIACAVAIGCGCAPGCSCGAAERTNLLVRFPQHADSTQRAGIFAGLMLLDYTVIEILRLREGNSSSSAPLICSVAFLMCRCAGAGGQNSE